MEVKGWCVRVDAMEGYGEKITMLGACEDYKSIAAIHHVGKSKENPHYHIVIATEVRDQAFRIRMKKIFNLGKGNAHMGIKSWNGDMFAISYLFHEEPDAQLFYKKNLSDEFVDRCRQLNKDVQLQVAESKGKASWTLEEDVLKYFQDRGERHPDERDVGVRVLLAAWRNNKYAPNDYLLKAIVGKVQFRLCEGDDESEEQLAARLVNKIYRY